MREIILLYLVLEVVLTVGMGRILPIASYVIFILNKYIFRSVVVCHFIKMYDWIYYHNDTVINNRHVKLLFRKCKITNKHEVEQLPRMVGIRRFRDINK